MMTSPNRPSRTVSLPRRIRYVLGAILAVIAMLGVLVGLFMPFDKTPALAVVPVPPSHIGMATTATLQKCASCHAAGLPDGTERRSFSISPHNK